MAYKDIASISPYYDDMDENKNFLRVLYNPGKAVQGRELIQASSILQNQIAKFGDNIFKDGASVYEAKINVDTDKPCIIVDANDAGAIAVTIDDTWIGQTLTGVTSGAIATVDNYNATDRILYINFLGGSFVDSEEVTVSGSVQTNNIIVSVNGSDVKGTLAHISKGIIYVNKHFVVCNSQSIIVEPQNVSNTHKIGINVQEIVVTAGDDNSLNDPSNGSYNFNAPGADRYNVKTILESYESAITPPDTFLSLVEIENGGVVKQQELVAYSEILDTLAKRTYDESGNYTIDQFNLKIVDHDSDANKLSIIIDPGKAYVMGYEVETVAPNTISIDKSRTTESKINAIALTEYSPSVDVDYSTTTNVSGTFDINAKEIVELMSGIDGTGDILGSTRILSIGQGATNELKLFLSDMDKYESIFSSVRSIRSQAKVTTYINVEIYANNKPKLYNNTTKSLIFEAEDLFISNIVNNQTTYTVTRNINATSDGTGLVTINAGTNEVFSSGSYVYSTINADGVWITGANIQSGAGTSSIIIENLPLSTNIDIAYTVVKQSANWKTKTLTQGTITANTDVNGELILSHVDVYDIISVSEDPAGTNIDVTDNVVLDTGSDNYFYDYGSVSGLAASTSHQVDYLYFSHGGTGDYFAVDSYLNTTNNDTVNPATNVAYSDFYGYIPRYTSTDGIDYDLRDTFDFRRSVTDLAAGVDLVIPNDTVTTDYSYYVPRIDKVFCDPYGNFGTITGVPELEADYPKDSQDAMVIGTLSLAPYTAFTNHVNIELKDTRRYTMEDIGEIERRLENVEYYSAMNLLEQDAKDLSITDKNGFDKFKNGILVDKFTGHDVADIYNVDYRCAIDPENEELRPSFLIDSINFQEDSINSNDITKHDNIITKSYTTTAFITQGLASETINVNPYNVFIWEGSIKLSPSTDNWVDTARLPDLIVNENDSNANWVAARNAARAFGTQWGWWRTNWVGVSRRTFTNSSSRRFFEWNWGGSTSGRVVTTRRTTVRNTRRGQSRFGTRMVVRPKTTRRSLGDSVVNTSIIPWIRSRSIIYTATRMKPNTTVLAYFDDIDVSANCSNLVTDSNGAMTGTYNIDANKFRTGDRILRFVDDATGNPSTSSEGTYSATGLKQVKRRTILSMTKPELVRDSISQSRVVSSISRSTTSSTSRVVTQRTRWSDPVAESFLINSSGGVFLSSIDLYFKTEPATSGIPITLRIVENDNGYPSQTIVPYSEVTLNPGSVTTVGNETNPVNATSFVFSDPVYLQDAVEYSFMLISNSNEYEIFIAKIGDNVIGTNTRIDKQPYTGVMFKSQNSSTWTADQERDIMFTINRCVFDTGITSKYAMNTNIDFATDKQVTTNMFNIDNITLDDTNLSLTYQYSGDSIIPFENKENIDLPVMKTLLGSNNVGTSDQLNIVSTLTTTKDNLSPILSVNDVSSIIVVSELSTSTVVSPNDGQSYKVGGRYITRATNLSNPSDDIKVILDNNKPSTTDIAVYFKTGLYEPRYIPITDTQEVDAFENETVYFYDDDNLTNAVVYDSSAIISQIDAVNNRYYLKSIEDSSKLTSAIADRTKFVCPLNDITFLETWAAATAYTVGQHVWEAGLLYENLVNDTGTTPGTNSSIWLLIQHTILTGAIVVEAETEWRDMIAETTTTANDDDYVETVYKPKEYIIDEFSTFSIKIELLTNDEVVFPKCKSLRCIAVY